MTSAESKRCLGCGYILEHLPEPRCPECGREFDPDDPRSFFVRRESGRAYFVAAVASAAAMGVPTVVFQWFLPLRLNAAGICLGAVGAVGLLVELTVIVAGILVLAGPAHRAEHRSLIATAILVGLAAIVASLLLSSELR